MRRRENKTAQINIRLRPSTKATLDRIVAAHGVCITDIIEDAIAAHAARLPTPPRRDWLKIDERATWGRV